MSEAYIVEAVRTPVGRRGGGLSGIHPTDLGGHVLSALVERAEIDPSSVDDVIFGCVDQIGAQSFNLARGSWLSAGLPESVPGTTVDRQCGSSLQALQFAAQAVMSGTQDIVIAGGVEVMSLVPIFSSSDVGRLNGLGDPFGGEGFQKRFPFEISQFRGAQLVAERWGFDRRTLEEFALSSHQRAARAWDEGRFDREVVPTARITQDEGFRRDTTLEKMATLAPLERYPALTAAVASQISDGAAAILVASPQAVEQHGLTPRAKIHSVAVVGSDPEIMLTGPIPATDAVLKRAKIRLSDIDLFEINEAFAPVVLAWAHETGADLAKTNVNGGAIALGHPLGATGAKLATTLVHELERSGGRYGLISVCEGGGTANAMILERVAA